MSVKKFVETAADYANDVPADQCHGRDAIVIIAERADDIVGEFIRSELAKLPIDKYGVSFDELEFDVRHEIERNVRFRHFGR